MSKSYHVTFKDLQGKTKVEINEMYVDPHSILNELAKKSITKKEVKKQRKGCKVLKNITSE